MGTVKKIRPSRYIQVGGLKDNDDDGEEGDNEDDGDEQLRMVVLKR